MKNLCVFLLVMITGAANGQVYVGMGIGSEVNATAGILTPGDFQVEANYFHPYSKTTKPKEFTATVGKLILLSTNDANNWVLVPALGVSFQSKYIENGGEYDEKITKPARTMPAGSLELGKDWNDGRLSIYTRYSKSFNAGITIKYFFQ